FQDVAPDFVCLLLPALKFQLMSLGLPFLDAGLFLVNSRILPRIPNSEHSNKRVVNVALDEIQFMHGSRNCDIKGIYEKLIDLKGLVRLVPGPPVFQLAVQVLSAHPIDNLPEYGAFT